MYTYRLTVHLNLTEPLFLSKSASPRFVPGGPGDYGPHPDDYGPEGPYGQTRPMGRGPGPGGDMYGGPGGGVYGSTRANGMAVTGAGPPRGPPGGPIGPSGPPGPPGPNGGYSY